MIDIPKISISYIIFTRILFTAILTSLTRIFTNNIYDKTLLFTHRLILRFFWWRSPLLRLPDDPASASTPIPVSMHCPLFMEDATRDLALAMVWAQHLKPRGTDR